MNQLRFYNITVPGAFMFVMLLSSLAACKKYSYDDALPKAEITSTQLNETDYKVEFTAKITDAGAASVDDVGFCYSFRPNVKIDDNQVIAEKINGEYKANLPLLPDSTYYIRCFAVNGYGYTIGEEMKYKVPRPAPQTAPCKLNDNEITDINGDFAVEYVYTDDNNPYMGVYSATISGFQTGGPKVEIYFKKKPINGVYTTFNGDHSGFRDTRNLNDIYVFYHDEFRILPGAKLYVAENEEGKLTISFCDFQYYIGNTLVTSKAKFTFTK